MPDGEIEKKTSLHKSLLSIYSCKIANKVLSRAKSHTDQIRFSIKRPTKGKKEINGSDFATLDLVFFFIST